jgi:hypothetical protein
MGTVCLACAVTPGETRHSALAALEGYPKKSSWVTLLVPDVGAQPYYGRTRTIKTYSITIDPAAALTVELFGTGRSTRVEEPGCAVYFAPHSADPAFAKSWMDAVRASLSMLCDPFGPPGAFPQTRDPQFVAVPANISTRSVNSASDTPERGDETERQRQYEGLGRWRDQEAIEAAAEYWTTLGAAGAAFLVGRMGREDRLDYLDAAAEVLSRFGRAALEPLLEALRAEHSPDQVAAFLRSARWSVPSRVSGSDAEALSQVAAAHYQSRHRDIREATYDLLRILPASRARDILSRAAGSESDSELREQLTELELDLGL